MKVTSALILRLAKMPAKDQAQVFTDNPTANFPLLIEKCNELSETHKDNTSGIAEKIDNLKFTAQCFLLKQQKGKDAVELVTHET